MLTQQEQQIIEFGKKQGKNKDQILKALSKYRSSNPNSSNQNQSRFQETVQDIKQVGSNIANRFNAGADKISEINSAQARGEQGVISSLLQKFGTGAKVASQSIGDIVTGGAKVLLSQEQEQAVKGGAQKGLEAVMNIDKTLSNLPGIRKLKEASREDAEVIIGVLNNLKEKYPTLGANVEAAFDTAMLGVDLAGIGIGGKLATKGANISKDFVKTGLDKGADFAENVLRKGESLLPNPKTATEQIAEKIAPKLTKKEIQKALNEGRVVRSGRLTKLLGKSDSVALDKRVMEVAQTIENKIPNAVKLNDQEIITAAQNEIKNISEQIAPKLKQVKLSEEIKDNIINSFSELKQAQIDDATFNSVGIISKQQAKFENILSEIIDSDNADDLWKSIQKYDDSIKSKVKEANQFSSDSAQELKDVWLENRRILRDALDSVTNNIQEVDVANDFRAMSNLYTAKQNIINAANFAKGDKELLRQFLLKAGVGGGAAALGFKLIE